MSRSRAVPEISRRDLLRAAMYGVGVSAAAIPSPLFAQAAAALATQGKSDGKILVVLELSGGNDGLNTLVPYGDDAYYKLRPKLGIPAKDVRKIDAHFGFSGGMTGLGCYKTAIWPSFTVAAMTIRRFHISPRWRIGTRPPQTAVKNTAGLVALRIRWIPPMPPISW